MCLPCSSYFLLHNSGEGFKLLVLAEQQILVSVGISLSTFSGCGMVVVARFHFLHTMDLKQQYHHILHTMDLKQQYHQFAWVACSLLYGKAPPSRLLGKP